MNKENVVKFEAGDIVYLVEHFNSGQLKHAIRSAENKAYLWRHLPQSGHYRWWLAFKLICELALKVKRKVEPQRHYDKLSAKSIRESVNIVDIVSRYIKLKRSGREYMGVCPFHSSRKGHNIEVNEQKQLYYCFSCNKSGNAVKFIMEVENLDFNNALKFLSGQGQLSQPSKSKRQVLRGKGGIPIGVKADL